MRPKRKTRRAAGHKMKQGANSMGDNPEDCPVCMMAYDDTVLRPRNLPCGHTFCSMCINGLKGRGQVTCPTCRTVHSIPKAGNFPVCYTLEAIIKRLKNTTLVESPLPVAGRGVTTTGSKDVGLEEEVAGLNRSMQCLLQEQKDKVLHTITACQTVQSQLDHYQTTLRSWHDQQQVLEESLQAVLDDSQSARTLLREEESRIMDKKRHVQQGEEKLHAVLETLQRVSTEQEAGTAVVDMVRCTDNAQQSVGECQAMFPDVHIITTARKVREASQAAVETFKTVQATLEVAFQPTVTAAAVVEGDQGNIKADPTSTIQCRLHTMLPPTVKAKDLHSPKQPARDLLKAKRVFAVHQVEGEGRYARISLEDEQLYLHSLQDQLPPLGATALKMSEVVPAAPPCVVFMDLAWPGTIPRRVRIHLNDDTPLGRQFLMLCTGQRGPSYANTRLWRVWNREKPGECVWGGDYERNDGTGGAALLPDLFFGKYWRSHRAGSVWGRMYSNPMQGAQFGILTRDRLDGDVFGDVFGKVVQGLPVVMAAAFHSDIREVTIVDCGMVL